MFHINVKVHPVVLLNIVDAYERRNPGAPRVIGTLLGSQDKAGNVEVSNSFVVQHQEKNNEVALDLEVAKELYELHRKVNPNEAIVGWFATGGREVNEYSVIIHDYYSRECHNPIHLTVDPTHEGIQVRCYVSTPFGVPGKSVGAMFSPVQSLNCAAGYETELIGLRAAMTHLDGKPKPIESELELILMAARRCQEIIGNIMKFIDEQVLNTNRTPPANSSDIGRNLMSMVESVAPYIGQDDEDMLNTNLKDLLMVIYLSNLSKTQLMLNEKLTLIK